MISSSCTIHIMDIRLLKLYISILKGGAIPDLHAEAMRHRQRDILINWSKKIIKASSHISNLVEPNQWRLYTELRPFFITADDPEVAVHRIEQLISACGSLNDVLYLFMEEIARLDPDSAMNIVTEARKDTNPGVLGYMSVEEIEKAMRSYLLYERYEIEKLMANPHEDEFDDIGKWISWRACMLMANLHPWWLLPDTSLTALSTHPELKLESLVADPRGIFATISQKIPGFHHHIPYSLTGKHQTGMCLPPQYINEALEMLISWPKQLPPNPNGESPTMQDITVFHEALLFAHRHQAGLWEASGMLNMDKCEFACIMPDQINRELHPEEYTHTCLQPENETVPANTITNNDFHESFWGKLFGHKGH